MSAINSSSHALSTCKPKRERKTHNSRYASLLCSPRPGRRRRVRTPRGRSDDGAYGDSGDRPQRPQWRRRGEVADHGAAPRGLQGLGLLLGGEPRRGRGADGRGEALRVRPLRGAPGEQVLRLRPRQEPRRRLRRPGRLGGHLLHPAPAQDQRRRLPGDPAADQGHAGRVRRADGGARGAPGRVREPQPGPPRRPRPGRLRAAVRGHQVRHVPAVPAAGPGVGPPRAHRRRRHHPAAPGRRRGRARVPARGPRVGPRGAHPGRQALRQHRGPDRGGQRRGLPECGAPRGRRRPGTAAVRGHVLQPRRRRHGGAGQGGVGVVVVPGAVQVRGLSRVLPGHQVRRQGRQVPGRQEALRLNQKKQAAS